MQLAAFGCADKTLLLASPFDTLARKSLRAPIRLHYQPYMPHLSSRRSDISFGRCRDYAQHRWVHIRRAARDARYAAQPMPRCYFIHAAAKGISRRTCLMRPRPPPAAAFHRRHFGPARRRRPPLAAAKASRVTDAAFAELSRLKSHFAQQPPIDDFCTHNTWPARGQRAAIIRPGSTPRPRHTHTPSSLLFIFHADISRGKRAEQAARCRFLVTCRALPAADTFSFLHAGARFPAICASAVS